MAVICNLYLLFEISNDHHLCMFCSSFHFGTAATFKAEGGSYSEVYSVTDHSVPLIRFQTAILGVQHFCQYSPGFG